MKNFPLKVKLSLLSIAVIYIIFPLVLVMYTNTPWYIILMYGCLEVWLLFLVIQFYKSIYDK